MRFVAILPIPDHGCPAGGDDPAGAAAADGGRGVDTARPVSVCKPLVVPVAAVPVQQHRRSLGRIYIQGLNYGMYRYKSFFSKLKLIQRNMCTVCKII